MAAVLIGVIYLIFGLLNIYMYEDAISPEGFEVTYYEFNQVPEKKNSDEICFSKIIKNADTAPNNTPLT